MQNPGPYAELDDDEYDDPLAATRPPAQEDRPPPLVLIGAGVGVLIGLLLWGSIALAAVSGVLGIFDDSTPAVSTNTGEESEAPLADDTDLVLDCDAFGPNRALSPEQEAAYQEQCVEPTPEPDDEPVAPADATLNREDCDAIRGTEYRSGEERQWFLDNCVN